jgi:tetratricopeptide (TPR) repeat protein
LNVPIANKGVRTMTVAEELSLLMQNHDDEPEAAAGQLRHIAQSPVPADQLGRFSWLCVHVIGEKYQRWSEAYELIVKASSAHETVPLAALRNAAVAAHLSGDLLTGLKLERRMTQHGLRPDQATTVVRAAALSFLPIRERAVDAAIALQTVVAAVRQWDETKDADTLVAASLNNIVSALLELDDETLAQSQVREAMTDGAFAARELWHRAGTWVNHERADYLCALVFNRLGEFAKALEAAERGRQLIETHGSEDVDRAFLMLESAQALFGLERREEGAGWLRQAAAIAEGWDDESLKDWFAGKAKPLYSMLG